MKRRIAIVPVQQTRLAIAGQLRIDVTVGDKQIHPTVVVVIKNFVPQPTLGKLTAATFAAYERSVKEFLPSL